MWNPKELLGHPKKTSKKTCDISSLTKSNNKACNRLKVKAWLKKKTVKKIKINQPLRMYGIEYEKQHYIKNFLPEVEYLLRTNLMNTKTLLCSFQLFGDDSCFFVELFFFF